jgi:hypothetical protein
MSEVIDPLTRPAHGESVSAALGLAELPTGRMFAMSFVKGFARIVDRLGPLLMLLTTAIVSGATLLAAG